jgi:CDP-diacylglycerol---serine O-phosphatidyltransferase
MFTVGNLACGFGSIIASGAGRVAIGDQYTKSLNEAVWLIILAAFFDFLDGLVARLSKSYSRFGVELDSLCDIVSFCVAPAAILVNFSLVAHGHWAWILAFVFLMAGSFRLARFNLSATLEKKVNFVGLPVPSAAMVIISYILFCIEVWGEIRLEKFFIIVILTTSVLMVSTIEFEAMPKFDFSQTKNRIKVLMLFGATIAIMINASMVIFPMAMLYIMYGIGKLVFSLVWGKKSKIRPKITRTPKKDNKEEG